MKSLWVVAVLVVFSMNMIPVNADYEPFECYVRVDVQSGSINLRANPAESSDIVGVAYKGTNLKYMGSGFSQDGDMPWVKVAYAYTSTNGTTFQQAFVRSDLVAGEENCGEMAPIGADFLVDYNVLTIAGETYDFEPAYLPDGSYATLLANGYTPNSQLEYLYGAQGIPLKYGVYVADKYPFMCVSTFESGESQMLNVRLLSANESLCPNVDKPTSKVSPYNFVGLSQADFIYLLNEGIQSNEVTRVRQFGMNYLFASGDCFRIEGSDVVLNYDGRNDLWRLLPGDCTNAKAMSSLLPVLWKWVVAYNQGVDCEGYHSSPQLSILPKRPAQESTVRTHIYGACAPSFLLGPNGQVYRY